MISKHTSIPLQKGQFMCEMSSVCYLLKCNLPAQPCSTYSGVYIPIKHLLRTAWVCGDGTCLLLYWYRTISDDGGTVSFPAQLQQTSTWAEVQSAGITENTHVGVQGRETGKGHRCFFFFFSYRNLVDLFGHSIFHGTGIHWHLELYSCLHQTLVTYCGRTLQFHFNGLLENRQLSVLLRRAATANKQLPDFLCQNVTSSWWRKISWKS